MKLFASIFTFTGLALLSIGVSLFIQEQNFLKKAHTATGKVIEMAISISSGSNSGKSVTYYSIVSFETKEGKPYTFSSSFSSNPPAYSVGEEVTVYYLPESPAKAEIKGFFSQWFAVIICSIMGLVFSSIGIGVWVSIVRKKKLRYWLQANGQLIHTSLQSVELNTSLTINGRSPYVIYSQWQNPSSKKVHVFKSDNIFYNPAGYMPGNTIQVRVDPQNYKKYQMDTSFLPEQH
jgi:hypothetical protein